MQGDVGMTRKVEQHDEECLDNQQAEGCPMLGVAAHARSEAKVAWAWAMVGIAR